MRAAVKIPRRPMARPKSSRCREGLLRARVALASWLPR